MGRTNLNATSQTPRQDRPQRAGRRQLLLPRRSAGVCLGHRRRGRSYRSHADFLCLGWVIPRELRWGPDRSIARSSRKTVLGCVATGAARSSNSSIRAWGGRGAGDGPRQTLKLDERGNSRVGGGVPTALIYRHEWSKGGCSTRTAEKEEHIELSCVIPKPKRARAFSADSGGPCRLHRGAKMLPASVPMDHITQTQST